MPPTNRATVNTQVTRLVRTYVRVESDHKRAPRSANCRGRGRLVGVDVEQSKPGMCECGCGGTTTVADKNQYKRGKLIAAKGEHRRFLPKHHHNVSHRPSREQYIARMMSNIERDENGCWNFMGARTRHGYGWVNIDRTPKAAHIHMYLLRVGPVPDGLELDHLCRNRACVNPDHLEPVTHQQNMARRSNRFFGECFRGHPVVSDEDEYVAPNGKRFCRRCVDMRTKRSNAKAVEQRKRARERRAA